MQNHLSVNPFDLLANETKPTSQKIKFLVGLVELMTKEEGVDRIPKLARAEIEEAIQEVYRSTGNPKLSDLRELLLKHPESEI